MHHTAGTVQKIKHAETQDMAKHLLLSASTAIGFNPQSENLTACVCADDGLPTHSAEKGQSLSMTSVMPKNVATKRLDKIKGPQVGVPPGKTMQRIVTKIDRGLEVCAGFWCTAVSLSCWRACTGQT